MHFVGKLQNAHVLKQAFHIEPLGYKRLIVYDYMKFKFTVG
jgi:hypothetical protein